MIRPRLLYKLFNWLQHTEPFFRIQSRLANEDIYLRL
jgi:hypothetical protein